MNKMTTTPRTAPAEATSATEAPRPVLTPRADVLEREDRIGVALDLPGVAPEDVEVTVERRTLRIRAKGRRAAPDGYRLLHAEYGEGDYERVFTLSEDVDADHVEARHAHGVLTLELPKTEAARPRRIEIARA